MARDPSVKMQIVKEKETLNKQFPPVLEDVFPGRLSFPAGPRCFEYPQAQMCAQDCLPKHLSLLFGCLTYFRVSLLCIEFWTAN